MAIYRGKVKSVDQTQLRWPKRRQAVEPVGGLAKRDKPVNHGGLGRNSGEAPRAARGATPHSRFADHCAKSPARSAWPMSWPVRKWRLTQDASPACWASLCAPPVNELDGSSRSTMGSRYFAVRGARCARISPHRPRRYRSHVPIAFQRGIDLRTGAAHRRLKRDGCPARQQRRSGAATPACIESRQFATSCSSGTSGQYAPDSGVFQRSLNVDPPVPS